MRDELLDSVASAGSRLSEMRLDTYLDVDQAVARYLELIKVAALIERGREGQSLDRALPEVNEILLQVATDHQREILETSALDGWLRDTERDPARRPSAATNGSEPSLDPFIPRRGEGLMLTRLGHRHVPDLPAQVQVRARLPDPAGADHPPALRDRRAPGAGALPHRRRPGSLEQLQELYDVSWRRSGLGDSDDERQFRRRGAEALERYWQAERDSDAEPVWFERSFSFKLGPHLLRGRVDRVDRRPDGSYELIDYKTGKAKTEDELREDVQLSLYQMGARESWRLETSAQSYFYVLTGEKVPVTHSPEELERVSATVAEIADGILAQEFEPKPSYDICRFCDYRIICPAAEK